MIEPKAFYLQGLEYIKGTSENKSSTQTINKEVKESIDNYIDDILYSCSCYCHRDFDKVGDSHEMEKFAKMWAEEYYEIKHFSSLYDSFYKTKNNLFSLMKKPY